MQRSIKTSLVRPNIFLSTQFLNIFSVRSSLNVRHQVSHSYKTTHFNTWPQLHISTNIELYPQCTAGRTENTAVRTN